MIRIFVIRKKNFKFNGTMLGGWFVGRLKIGASLFSAIYYYSRRRRLLYNNIIWIIPHYALTTSHMSVLYTLTRVYGVYTMRGVSYTTF